MAANAAPPQIVDLSPARRIWLNTLDLAEHPHCMYALLEVDVTAIRQVLAQHKARTGEALSFTGYLVFCLARAVAADKTVQAYRKGRKQLVLFDDVDVGLMIEGHADGRPALLGYTLRRANHKTFREIHQEIRAVQSAPAPPGRGMPGWFRSAMLLPWPLSSLFSALLRTLARRDPTIFTALGGTVGVSAVGMFGKGHSGWGLYPGSHSLELLVGGTAWKPAVVDGRIEPRQCLSLTVVLDHTVVDGGPAARFVARLVEVIESGIGLEDGQLAPAAAGAPG
jgi:pyruvate/2-oxoglutarate dehydrogenase complex dihydrolipoamide acyltransferase (E2) component